MEIYYIYITKTGRIIYKRLRNNNFMKENETNSYEHRLILKQDRFYIPRGAFYAK